MTNQVNNQRHKYHPLTAQYHNDSEDDDRSGCRNVSHCHQQFFSELHSPGRSHYTNYVLYIILKSATWPQRRASKHKIPLEPKKTKTTNWPSPTKQEAGKIEAKQHKAGLKQNCNFIYAHNCVETSCLSVA